MLVALNPYYAMAALYLTLGALAALEMVLSNLGIVPPMQGLMWMRIHTIVLGGITQVIFGTLPGFLARRAGVAEPDRSTRWRLWAVLNLGILVSMVGMVSGQMYIFGTGAVFMLLADVCLLRIIWSIGSQAKGENRLMARFYALAIFYLFLGITMALTKQLGWPPAPAGPVGAREAHIHANAWGFLNIVLAVSLFDWIPKLLGRPLENMKFMHWVWWGLAIGDFLLVLGPWLGEPWVTSAGLIPYGAAVISIYVSIISTATKAKLEHAIAGWQLVASYFWLALPAALAPFVQIIMPDVLPLGRIELVAVQSLISGWALQLAMVAIPVVIARMQSGEPPAPCKNPKRHRAILLVALIANNVGAALFWVAGLAVPDLYGPVLAIGYALVGLAWIPFLVRTWRSLTTSAAAA